MMGALALLPHVALMLVAAPVLAGVVGSASLAQPWRDLRKLFRKPGLWPQHARIIGAVPAADLGASLLAALLVPSFTLGMVTAPLSDLIVIGGLLSLARVALMLASFDAGTGLPSLFGQRAAVARAAAEPGLLVLVLVVAAAGGSSNLDVSSAALRDAGPGWGVASAALAAALLLLALAQSRLHEPFAGRDLAVVRFAAQLRRVTVLSIVAALLLPFGLAPAGSNVELWVVGAACWAVKLAALGAIAAALRSAVARLRPDQAVELAVLGLLVALIAAALVFAGQHAA